MRDASNPANQFLLTTLTEELSKEFDKKRIQIKACLEKDCENEYVGGGSPIQDFYKEQTIFITGIKFSCPKLTKKYKMLYL